MRITRLAADNRRTQGPDRRAWYRRHSPAHLRAISALVDAALAARDLSAPARAVILGAGACTELPLERLVRPNDDGVLLVDIDVAGMARSRDALPAALRGGVDLLQEDLTGGVSEELDALLRAQPWGDLATLGGMAPLDVAASCLERCPVPDPPPLPRLPAAAFGLVVSDLVLTQLYSLPLLDVADALAAHAPAIAPLRDTHPRYAMAARAFRRRVALAHLSLLRLLLAPGGVALLLSDRTGYLLPPTAGPHARDPRDQLIVLPPDVLAIPGDLAARFTLTDPIRTWEWLVSAPGPDIPGRLYDAFGAVLRPPGS
jgi:hypothetical protein